MVFSSATFLLLRYGDRTGALLYRDSHAQALIPYLINTFDELIVVPRPKMDFHLQLLNEYNPDVVILQFIERALYWRPSVVLDEKI